MTSCMIRRMSGALLPELPEGLVFVDEHLLVLDKPAGLLAVPGRGADKQDCLATRAQRMWPDARIVHRLDQPTSGLVLMGRGARAHRRLGMAFERREVHKRYVAVVAGELPISGDWQVIDLPIWGDPGSRPMQEVHHTHGRTSVTRWRAMEVAGGTTRVELEPLTGRTHQLRVHLKAIGHPILGDPLYASREVEALAPRLLLHAASLALFHPATGEPISFESRVPF